MLKPSQNVRLDCRCRLWGYESYSLLLMAVLLAFLQFHLRGVVLKCYGVCSKIMDI
jgi:hypothetical protein